MAKKTGSEDDGSQMIANVGARRDRMKDAFEKLFRLENEKAELEEEHLSNVKAAIKKERKNVTADCNVTWEDIKHDYGKYKREKFAKSLEDESERDRILDNLRFAHEVLVKGQMVDFVSVMEESEAS